MCFRIPFYIYSLSGRLHFVKKEKKMLYPTKYYAAYMCLEAGLTKNAPPPPLYPTHFPIRTVLYMQYTLNPHQNDQG
jgi:hypothetical protein